MAKFFVGQRVRVVWAAEHAKHLVGHECRIIDETEFAGEAYWTTDLTNSNDLRPWHCKKTQASTCLAPIEDQKHEACDEEFKLSLDELLERQREAA